MTTERLVRMIGVGGALMDKKVQVKKEHLEQLGIKEIGGSQMIDKETLVLLKQNIQKLGLKEEDIITTPGGSGCNVMKSLSACGVNVSYVAKIGKDSCGQQMVNALEKRNTKTLFSYSETENTGEVICLVTEDGERTMRAYLGATSRLTAKELPDMTPYTHIHIEGYNVYDKELTNAICKAAKEANLTVSFDLGSHELVANNRDYLLELIQTYVHICFANEEEAMTLFQVETPEEALKQLGNITQLAIVTLGKKGCIIATTGQPDIKCPSVNVIHKPVDTTGAGDIFSAGFLYGYLSGAPLSVAAQMGSAAGCFVIQSVSTELKTQEWKMVRSILEKHQQSTIQSQHLYHKTDKIQAEPRLISATTGM